MPIKKNGTHKEPFVTEGVVIRARLDMEIGKALILINGAGIIALLAFSSALIKDGANRSLLWPVLVGTWPLIFGLVFALAYLRFNRECSRIYENAHPNQPKPRPFECKCGTVSMFLSGVSFCTSAAILTIGIACQLSKLT